MNASRWLYVVLALAVGAWLLTTLGGEERRIRGRLTELGDLLEKDNDESPLAAAEKSRRVGLLFTRDFEIRLEPFQQVVTDRRQVTRTMLGYRSRFGKVSVGFRDEQLEIDEAAGRADLALTAVVSASRDGGPSREAYRLAFHLRKVEGEWLIERADLLEVLEGAPIF